MMKSLFLCIVTMFCTITLGWSQDEWIWWEGENPTETNFPSNTWFSGSAIDGKRDLLSNGQWLTQIGERTGDASFAKYKVNIPEAGTYDFWARKYWKHGPFRWRFEDQDWRICSRDITLADSVPIQKHLSVNWVYLDEVTLPKGEVTFELRLLADKGESQTACFDCFILTQIPFDPRGKLKPGEKTGLAEEGFFPWEPGRDTFESGALLDLSWLNEDTAGMNGFVKSRDGKFILGNGDPVKFWAVNVSSGIAGLNRDSVDYLAKKLAKLGVNMIRYHSAMFESNDVEQIDQEKLNNLHYLIHAMKQQGIYTKISFYFPLWFTARAEYGFQGYDTIDNNKPFALLFFESRMQEIYRSWAEAMLTTKNPYTGKAIVDDPAVAIVEIINEDSFFFWTFTKDNVPDVYWKQLESRFAEWLIKEYGSLRDAYRAWGGQQESRDDLSQKRMALYDAWHMTGGAIQQAGAAKKKRVGDQVRFLTHVQRDFYEQTIDWFENDLGLKCLVSPSNWHVTDPNMLDALERYTYMAGDVIDKHGYFSGPHESNDGSHRYSVAEGHTFENLSALTVPERLPLQFIQIKDYPHTISEIGWTNPNLYRSDYSFLASCYGALQGVDAFFAFAIGSASWEREMDKFSASAPVILGNFPAYALLYRRGDVEESDPVIQQILDLEDLFAMKGSGGVEAQALDEFRHDDIPPGESTTGEVKGFDPLSFYVGKVTRSFEGNPEDSIELNLSKWINREENTIKSITDELLWDYGQGVARLNSDKSQGAAGFLAKHGKIECKDVIIECGNEYATVMVTSLDDFPIRQSKRLLVQAMTVERPYGFESTGNKEGRILDKGRDPFGVEKIDVKIQFKKSQGNRMNVIPLDLNGYPRGESANKTYSADAMFQLKSDAVYTIVKMESATSIRDWNQN